jgi:hypothetical protein
MRLGGKRSRVSVSALLVLLCLGPALTALHELRAEHRFCPEHQTVEEGGAIPDAAGETPAGTGMQGQGDAESHAQCLLARGLASPIALPRPADASALLRAGEPAAGIPPEFPVRLSILRLAPKTSPPSYV